MKRVDYLIIGAGQAGLAVKKHLANRDTVLIDHDPAGYKIGESIVTDYFSHPSVHELMPKIVKLPSFTRKIGSTFVSQGSVAFFPLGEDNTSFHISRHELERLMIDEWGIDVVRERVRSVDVRAKRVTTDRQTYEVRKQIIDCSGPAMVVAQSLQEVDRLWPVYSTWTYFDVEDSDAARFWRHIESKGLKYLCYDDSETPGRLLGRSDDERWDPKVTTILTMLREGMWTWQIPLDGGRLLSFGAVSRHGEVRESELLDIAARTAAPNYTLKPRDFDPSSPYNRVHVRNHFARKARTAATEDYILVADAFCFADPIYSVGVALAVNEGIEVATLLNEGDGWNERKRAAYCAKYDALIARALKAFGFWYSGELVAAESAADEVQKGFLVGDAFQVNVAKHYGTVLQDSRDIGHFKVDIERDVLRLLGLGEDRRLSGWELTESFRYSYGLRLRWRRGKGREAEVGVVRDPSGDRYYSKVGPIGLMYVTSKRRDEGAGDAALKALMEALAGRIRDERRGWETIATPLSGLRRDWLRRA